MIVSFELFFLVVLRLNNVIGVIFFAICLMHGYFSVLRPQLIGWTNNERVISSPMSNPMA